MIKLPDRQGAVSLIEEARAAGARCRQACEALGISVRTFERWTREEKVQEDGRPTAQRQPANRISEHERAQILEVVNSERYRDLPPTRIVPSLADEGRYLASESTFYRILRAENLLHHRGRARAPQEKRPAATHSASGPNEVWCWDITWLAARVKGQFFYLYLILDLYSRKIVGWEVYENESSELAAEFVEKACLREKILGKPLILHSDNGSPMKGSTLVAKLEALGVTPSKSRPRVSNDNAFAESIFRTCKYRPGYPQGGFESLEKAQSWVGTFAHWYNHEHQHSALKFVTPQQRHSGLDQAIRNKRKAVYAAAKLHNPHRWTRGTRNWELPTTVWLNPEKNDEPLKEAA